jgi:hypothetical protein
MVPVGLRECSEAKGDKRMPKAGKEGMPEIARKHSPDVSGAITAVGNRQCMKSI